MEFKLPDIGEGIAEGEVVKWLVRAGDTVHEDQPIVQIMTDKATVEIPSPRAGRIARLCAAEGEIVPVGQVLLEIEEAAHAPESPTPRSPATPPAAPSATAEPAPVSTTEPAYIPVAPAVRALAKQLGVDLAVLRGSGPGGRITAEDVQRAAEARRVAASPTAPAAQGMEERVPIRGIRRKVAERMVLAKQIVPHYAYMDEVDVTELVSLRQRMKPEAERQGVRLTFLSFILRAVVAALKKCPRINASVDEERKEIIVKRYYNIGIATATPEGVVVPVLKDADQRSLFDIAREIDRLVTAARLGRSSVKDLQGGTFTITNVGSLGGLFAAPIVNYPEVAILATQKITKRPAVRDNQIVIRDLMHMSISLDHRVVDGAEAVEFMNQVIHLVEDPQQLVG